MGLIDVSIDEIREEWDASPNSHYTISDSDLVSDPVTSNSNLEQPLSSGLVLEDHGHGTNNYMDLELYLAAAERNSVDVFIDVLGRVSTEKNLTFETIFESVSPMGNTLLHVAATSPNEEIVRMIARHFPSILIKRNSKGDTALHVAVKAKNWPAVFMLTYFKPRRVIESSSSSDDGENVREVVLYYLLLRMKNEEGNTALHEALLHGHTDLALQLIHADPAVSFYLNKEGKSPLYMAAKSGYLDVITSMLVQHEDVNPDEKLKGKSPIHAAVIQAATVRRKTDVLDFMLTEEPRFLHLRDDEGRSALHCAASTGYLEGVRYLLGKYASGVFERDKNVFFPIHVASIKGHVDVIEELLQHWPDPGEMLGNNNQNILHVAAKSGKLNVVSYILRTPKLKKLINQRDKDGNTPLHLATMHWHPKIVSALTWDEKVDLKLINNEGLTAFDAAVYYMERTPSFRKRLTWVALKSAGAPRAPPSKALNTDRQNSMHRKPSNMDNYKDRVNTLLLVATLVATVTFAAGFTMPGGYNNSDPDQGMATMLRDKKFHIFIFCDSIAMYSSVMVAVILIWAQLGDLHLVLTALRLALPLLGISLTMMSLAFMACVYLVVSKLSWLANAVLIMGLGFLASLSVLFFPLCFPVSSSHRILRYISYYPFCLLMWVTGSSTTANSEE